MKQRYDRKAVLREFKPGDKAMVFLPILGSALQPFYTGPYHVERRVSDVNYVIATPDTAAEVNVPVKVIDSVVSVSALGVLDSATALPVTCQSAAVTSALTQRGPAALLLGEEGVRCGS